MNQKIFLYFTILLIEVLILSACGPIVRAERRYDIEHGKLKAGMTYQEVVELMGYTTSAYNDETSDGYLCRSYPIDWHDQNSVTWVSLLFRDKRLISHTTSSGKKSYASGGCESLIKSEREQARKNMPPAIHKYLFKIVDFRGNPVPDAIITYDGFDKEKKVKQGKVSTNLNGEASIEVSTTALPKYATNITYVIQKNEYFQKKGDSSIGTDGDGQKYEEVKLSSLNEYLCNTMITNNTFYTLRQTIHGFLLQVILEGLLADSFLAKDSICFETFKSKRYVSFTFASGNVYNSIKMDKYDMGKRLFDEVVRKVLGPMNDHMRFNKDFDGYKLSLNAHTKSFLDKEAKTEKVVYDFYLPKETVSAYKDKDIAGQALLDRSIILMNDERVEFRLQ